MSQFVRANLFELHDKTIQVSYSDTSILGGPLLNYRDERFNLSFRGEEIRIQDTEIGQLITVTLETIPDLQTVTFTLILPIVTVMSQGSETHVDEVPAITTTNPTTIAGPPPGAQQLYCVAKLQGTAQFIVS
jgi:hypothetical protein